MWKWGLHIFAIRAPMEGSWHPTLIHAILDNKLPWRFQEIQFWWDHFWLRVLWQIWKRRNAILWPECLTSTKNYHYCLDLAWYNRLHLDWLATFLQELKIVGANDVTTNRLWRRFNQKWGEHHIGPYIQGDFCYVLALPAMALLVWCCPTGKHEGKSEKRMCNYKANQAGAPFVTVGIGYVFMVDQHFVMVSCFMLWLFLFDGE